jgi:hypothetical protein
MFAERYAPDVQLKHMVAPTAPLVDWPGGHAYGSMRQHQVSHSCAQCQQHHTCDFSIIMRSDSKRKQDQHAWLGNRTLALPYYAVHQTCHKAPTRQAVLLPDGPACVFSRNHWLIR